MIKNKDIHEAQYLLRKWIFTCVKLQILDPIKAMELDKEVLYCFDSIKLQMLADKMNYKEQL